MNTEILHDITVTDSLGETFPLASCTILCPWAGELDYGDPVALILPDGETVTLVGGDYGISLTDEDGEPVAFDGIFELMQETSED